MSRPEFEKRLNEFLNSSAGKNHQVISDKEQTETVAFLLAYNAGSQQPRDSKHYRWIRTLTLTDYGGHLELTRKDSGKRVVPKGELYNIIHSCHMSMGHSGRDKLSFELNKTYHNVARKLINMYLATCAICDEKRNRPRKNVVVKPIISDDMNARAQVDLICFESQKDRQYTQVLTYQDHLSKFVQLRALQTKRAAEVAKHLVDIFCILGAPAILQSDNGREFTAQVVEECVSLWPDLKIVHGQPRHSQAQGSVERANRTAQEKLVAWMRDNDTKKWAEGLRFVQFQMNTQVHQGIGRQPYEAMFGCAPKLGLAGGRLPAAVLATLATEEDLESLSRPTTAAEPKDHDEQPPSPTAESPAGSAGPAGSPGRDSASPAPSDQTSSSAASAGCTVCGAPMPGTSGLEHCQLCERAAEAERQRVSATECQKRQAATMLRRSRDTAHHFAEGDNVRLGIPDYDRSRDGHRNLICVVLQVDNDLYKIGTRHGRLDGHFSNNQLDKCRGRHLRGDDVPEITISVREAARLASGGSGQGFLKCSCKKLCSARCTCVKSGLTCTSRCHHSTQCNNK